MNYLSGTNTLTETIFGRIGALPAVEVREHKLEGQTTSAEPTLFYYVYSRDLEAWQPYPEEAGAETFEETTGQGDSQTDE